MPFFFRDLISFSKRTKATTPKTNPVTAKPSKILSNNVLYMSIFTSCGIAAHRINESHRITQNRNPIPPLASKRNNIEIQLIIFK